MEEDGTGLEAVGLVPEDGLDEEGVEAGLDALLDEAEGGGLEGEGEVGGLGDGEVEAWSAGLRAALAGCGAVAGSRFTIIGWK